MLAPRRRCLAYSKCDSDVTERWFFAWNQKKFTYCILYILIPNSVLDAIY